MKVTTTTARLSLIGLAVALSACSVIEESKIDYKSAKKASTLEVPPDLTQLTRDTRYTAAPDRSVSAVALAAGQQNQVPVVERAAPLKVGDVEIMRDGNKRWLVVNRPADQLWEPTREFWIDHGFNLSQEKPDLGIIETDWAENRAKLPQDIIRSTIGKLFDSLYSTSERDRFRTRLERRPDGKTEIFITHRGMEEVYSNSNKDSTVWQPRDADPELETEFLRRLMIKLGTSEEQSRALVAADKATAVQAAPSAPSAKIATINGQPAVELEEPFDRAWRRVGVALDRTGFTVEDRDRSKGLYYVRYVAPNPDTEEKKKGWFSGLFSSKPENKPSQYQIAVRSSGEQTQVTVLDAKGQPETTQAAQRIVRVIADDLK